MFSPAEVAANYAAAGAKKAKLPFLSMLVLGIFAGVFIGVAGVGCSTAAVSIQAASAAKLVGALIFPTGLALVVLTGSELFTGNTLIFISVLEKQATWGGMLRNWVVVYIGNFIGSLLVAAAVVYGHTFSLFGGGLAESAVATAAAKASLSFGDAFIRGILCNVLVCAAVWMALAAKDVAGKVVGLYLPIMLFVLCGYEHSVANMYFIPAGLFAMGEYGIAADGLTWGAFLVKNLLPVTLGNIVGGGLFLGGGLWLALLRKSRATAGVK